MTTNIPFRLDEVKVEAKEGETIWQTANRYGLKIPHLCFSNEASYNERPDGNCRVCMVEVDGQRVLSAACMTKVQPDMVVRTNSMRAAKARRTVLELLTADLPHPANASTPESLIWFWARDQNVTNNRFPKKPRNAIDKSHPAITFSSESCIHCTLCVRACREVQVNNVIGLANRGVNSSIVFDSNVSLGDSTCVGCGECVQACPTGALLPSINVTRPDKKVNSICPYCGVGCQITYKIKHNTIVGVDGRDGPSNAGRLCVKGRYGFDYINNTQRLLKPLLRKKGVNKGDLSIDPSNPFTHFREASWQEALDAAAEGLMRIRDARGGNSLAGFGSAKGSNEEAYLFQKLVRTGFKTNNVDHCTRLCHASSVAALMETIGSGAVTAPFTEALNSDVILVIGSHPESNHPVAATFLKQAVNRGTKLIVVDPREHSLTAHATWMLKIKPATDVALLNSILNVLVEEKLVNTQYVNEHTENYSELAKNVRQFSPEKMEKITGVPAKEVREAARAFGRAGAAMVFWGMGISQHIHGTDNARCLISLCLITGNIGKPGTGLHPLRGQNNVQGASDAGLIPMVYPDYQPVSDPLIHQKFEAFWNTSLDSQPGLTVVEITDAIYAGNIKGLYVMGENPAMSDPNVNHARQALSQLTHLVVQDIFLTETACFADVILPATAWPEKDGTVTNTNRQVQLGRQAVSAPGQAKPDLWIIQQIALRLNLGWKYSGPEDVFEEMRQCMPSIYGITWERLRAEESITYPCPDEAHPGSPIIFSESFPTPSGRGKFVPSELTSPDEIPDKNYPIIFMTGRLLEHWHTGTMTRRAKTLDYLEPEAVAHLAPAEIEKLGIMPGELILIESRRGSIKIKARADNSIQIGSVFVPFCFAEAAANLLTNAALDPFGKIPEVKYCAVRIRPFAID